MEKEKLETFKEVKAKKKEKLEKTYGVKVEWYGKKRICGLPISFTMFILTESKLITRQGLFNLKEDEVELYKVTDQQCEFPLSQRIVGCGTLKVISTDKDTPIKVMKAIKRPRLVKQLLDKLVTAQRDKYLVRGRDMTGAYMSHDDMADMDTADGFDDGV